MNNIYRVSVLGATGLVGQKVIELIKKHPYFSLNVIAASDKSRGKIFMGMPVHSIEKDIEYIASNSDIVFSVFSESKEKTKEIEEEYAKRGVAVVSCSSANRLIEDVPMIIPEINHSHFELITEQKKRLGGFIVTKSNCSLHSYLPPIYALLDYGIEEVVVSTYQSVSGAGKSLILEDNLIPYIEGEEEKSESEPRKILANLDNQKLINSNIKITAQCIRVPVNIGHTATVWLKFRNKPSKEEILKRWQSFSYDDNYYQVYGKKPVIYTEDPYRPQPALDILEDNSMSTIVGRLREDRVYDYKFVSVSNNLVKGSAGGAVLLAEMLVKKGYVGRI